MKCLFCGTNTKVTNSRARIYGVWRRRKCENAHIFTTTEQVDLSVLSVNKRKIPQESFDPHKLGLSLSKCGLTNTEVVELQRTIISKILKDVAAENTVISSKRIAGTTYKVLKKYDPQYADRYKSYSKQLN